jgi:small-conductance mechanosensitive channel
VARILRAGTLRIGEGVNRVFDTLMPSGRLAAFRLSGPATKLIGDIVFWLTIFFVVTVASDVAELLTFSTWLKTVVAYLPHLLGGGIIILVGYLISSAVRDLLSTTLASVGVSQSELVGAAAQWATFLTAIIVGIDQVGIDVTFLIIIIAIVLGSILGGMAIAFGLGAKPLVTNLIGAHYLQQHYAAGQIVRIGEHEGRVLEFSATGIVLDTKEGRATIPGASYFDQRITVKEGSAPK